jgi:hypothetical protein
MKQTVIAASALALASACAFEGRYDKRYFRATGIAEEERLDGRALVLTSSDDDEYVYSARPTGFAGSGTTLTLPLGVVVREAALKVFGDLFRGGADALTDRTGLEGYRAVVSPRLAGFSHVYGWTTASVVVSVRVSLLDAKGNVLREKTYSDEFESEGAGALRASGSDAGSVMSRMAQVAVQTLMLRAAADVKAFLEAPHGRAPDGAAVRKVTAAR